MPGHPSAEAMIELVEGRAGAAERRHVAACDACRAQLAELDAALERLRDTGIPEPSPLYWETFRRKLRQRIDEDARPPQRRLWLWLPALAAAAALALALAPRLGLRGLAPSASPATAFVPAWTPLPEPDDDTGLAILETLASTGGLRAVAECQGIAECLAGLPDEDVQHVARAFRAEIEGGES